MSTGTILSVLPLLACGYWWLRLVLNWRQSDAAKQMLTLFFGVCTVLYACHALLYNVYAASGLPHLAEVLWATCSLSVYPIYYLYLCRLTARPLPRRAVGLILAPGLLVALLILLFPGRQTDTLRAAVNGLQVLLVVGFGYRRLSRFDAEVQEFFADTEGKDVRALRWLLVAFLLTAVNSVCLNILGRNQVMANVWLILLTFDPIALLLFALGHIGYHRTFLPEQSLSTLADEEPQAEEPLSPAEQDDLGARIERLMLVEGYYLRQGITLSGVAREVGSCRTYVSRHINQHQGCSFSDYVNRLRVEHAKRLILSHYRQGGTGKLSTIATDAGFSGEQAFYRNFRKFTGTTPAAWLDTHRPA